MAKRKPGFQKGQSGNPNGRPKLPFDVEATRQMNQIDVARAISRYLQLPISELQDKLKDKNESSLNLMVASVIYHAIKKGDQSRLNLILDRCVGKVKDKVEVSGSVYSNLRDLVKRYEQEDE